MGFVPDWFVWGIIGVIGVVSILWIVGSASIAQKTANTSAGKVLLGLILVPAPFVYLGAQNWHYKYKYEHATRIARGVIAETLMHLSRACEQDEKFNVFLPFEPKAGVFYSTSYEEDKKLDFGNRQLAEAKLPENGFQAWWTDMRRGWYGEHYSPTIDDQ